MSVINRVLKDLDRHGEAPSVPSGVRLIAAASDAPFRRQPWLLGMALILALGLAAWQWWPASAPPPNVATPALVQAPVSPAPSAAPVVVATPAPVQAPAPAAPHPAAVVVREAEATQAPRTLTGRMETRLPEVGAPKVSKEVRQFTPKEQADEAFRQASRLVEQGRNREAQARLDEALQLDASHTGARQTLVVLLMETGDAARAEALLKEGQAQQPGDPWYPRTLGQLYLQRGDNTQALAVLKAGLNKGVDAGYWGFYAALLNKLGRGEETAQAYREAARLNPEHGPWWVGLAVALEQAGHKAEAGEAYRRALQTRLSAEVREFAAQKAQDLR